MKHKTYLRTLAIIISLLIISLPICFANELSLIYDANGNLIKGDGKFREYNSLNQLVKIYNGSDTSGLLLEEYIYHPIEERILVKNRSDSSGLVETVYYIDENFVRVSYPNGTNLDYTYVKHEGQLIAQEEDGNKYYTHTDHLGSTSVITNSSGDVIENTTYSPYGEVLTGGSTSRYDYEGKEYDDITKSYDFNFRQYDPSIGIYGKPDTLVQNVYDPQSLNRYMFERGNPYKYKDETGHWLQAVTATLSGIVFLASAAVIAYNIHMGKSPSPASYGILVMSGGFLIASTLGIASPAVMTTEGYISYLAAEAIFTAGSGALLVSDISEIMDDIEKKEEDSKDGNDAKKIEKGAYIDSTGTEVPIQYPKGTSSISIGGGKGGMTRAVIVGYKSDGTPVWGAPGTKYNPPPSKKDDSNKKEPTTNKKK